MADRKPLILVVDDTELNRDFLREMLEQDYRIMEAENGLEAIAALKQYDTEIALVLLDVVMPQMDGFEVLAMMNRSHWIDNIPVVMISAETSPDYIARGYELGAVDYISRPFDGRIVKQRVNNTIILYAKQRHLQNIVVGQIRQQERNNIMMVDILSTIVEFRNGESGVHVLRIRIITEILLEELAKRYPKYGLDNVKIAEISNAAALHDVGKIAIPEEILNKPGKLTKEEFEVIKTHAAKGAEMLEKTRFGKKHGLARYAHDICRWHHERWDGMGYPDGLRENEIPICAQAVSLADVYDALVSPRVYKPAYSHKKAIQMILNGECGIFNPDLINCLLEEEAHLEERIRLHSEDQDRLFDQEWDINLESGFAGAAVPYTLLGQEQTKYQLLSLLSDEILFDYDARLDTVLFSGKKTAELGLEPILTGASSKLEQSSLLSQEDFAALSALVRHTTPEKQEIQETYLLTLKDGTQQWYELSLQVLWSQEKEPRLLGCTGTLVNTYEHKAELARLKQLSEQDPLTGLYNKDAGQKLIRASLQACPDRSATLLLLAVNGLKTAEDAHGRLLKDHILRHMAGLITRSIHSEDFAARMEGEEFLIFLPDSGQKNSAAQKAEKILDALYSLCRDYGFSVSIGGAAYPQDGTSYESVWNSADQALFRSQELGENQYAFLNANQLQPSEEFAGLKEEMK